METKTLQPDELSFCGLDRKCNINSVLPLDKTNVVRWNGWGYKDSGFKTEKRNVVFCGNRYKIGDDGRIPYFELWAKKTLNIDWNLPCSNVNFVSTIMRCPTTSLKSEFLDTLKVMNITYSIDNADRLVRSHGQSLNEILNLKQGSFKHAIPDVVIWPDCHKKVEEVVKAARLFNIVVIPFGGGTSVSGAVSIPYGETRPVISLDMSKMNRLLWISEENLTVSFEAGIIGQDMERELHCRGYTTGHEPDSMEFSSLGGWLATRASGMKRKKYGNIEDLVLKIRVVTPKGTLELGQHVPRLSCGPDFRHIILGSEGTLGIITEVALKLRPLPIIRQYDSFIFPNFELGVQCMQEISRNQLQPASVRLMDNEQFKFGQSLRSSSGGYISTIMEGFQKLYLCTIKDVDVDSICVMTLLYEGNEQEVIEQQAKINKVCKEFNGISAGARNGRIGYNLTFVIAYIRDVALDYQVVAESFETSVCWSNALSLCYNVKRCITTQCKAFGIEYYLVSCRVTQTYDQGCCIYFYFAFNGSNIVDPIHTYELIESIAREEIFASGGCISHHHGVGKIRSKWYRVQVTPFVTEMYKSIKHFLDPDNILAVGNLCRL